MKSLSRILCLIALGVACSGTAFAQAKTEMAGTVKGLATESRTHQVMDMFEAPEARLTTMRNYTPGYNPNLFGPVLHSLSGMPLFLTNDGSPCWLGIKIAPDGGVGIGQVDTLGATNNGYMWGRFQVSNIEPLIVWDGGSGKRLMWNAAFTTQTTNSFYTQNHWDRPTASPAFMLTVDHILNTMSMEVAQPGETGDPAEFWCALNVSAANDSTFRNVGIKLGDWVHAQRSLDINGEIGFVTGDFDYDYAGGLSSDGYEVYANDIWYNYSQLSSHYDPARIDPQAKSSFADPSIALPFSVHHENKLIGKGQVVDMAKIVAYVEKKMKAELGEADGKVVYNYDLPAEKCKSMQDYQVELMMNELAAMKDVKVEVADNGSLPDDAVAEVDEVQLVPEKKIVKERSLDLATKKIVATEKEITVNKKVKTGRKIIALKEGYSFQNGELYRKPTVKDIDMKKFNERHPGLPSWITMRIQSGQQTSMNISDLVNEIKSRQEAKAATASNS